MQRSIRTVLFALLLASSGCGPSVYKPKTFTDVTGKVLVNGKPLELAMVHFTPEGNKGEAGTARTDATGTFVATTVRGDKGLPDGKYRVTVSKFKGMAAKMEPDPSGVAFGGKQLIPPQYSRELDSQIFMTVPATGNYDIALKINGFRDE